MSLRIIFQRKWEPARGVEMGHLGEGMDAGVGATRTLDIHLRSEELPGRSDQGPLDAPGVLLRLPAAVAGSVVLDRQLVFMRIGSHRLPSACPTETSWDQVNALAKSVKRYLRGGFDSPFSGGSPRRTIPSRLERRSSRVVSGMESSRPG